jgi:CHAT domain-containing protein
MLLRLFPESMALLDEAATWDGLLDSTQGAGQSDFSFLHVASHAFADRVSGRLSGLALYDRDVWLDELWDCAPLPPLITLSACSGSKSRLYSGDEQVGLATTCLAAGARQVVASLWPIQDKEAADFMMTFYSHLMLGSSAAQALAKAQRAAIQNRKDVAHWAGFRCTGLPD